MSGLPLSSTSDAAPATDPRVVLVYVNTDGDASSVKKEDIAEWLAILGDVEHVKLQYDVARRSNCYQVSFLQPRAAQQAVQHLDGQRLKGCTIDIHSSAYQRVEREGATSGGGEPLERRAATSVNTGQLPHNHRIPKDVRMDVELAALLPSLAADSSHFPDSEILWHRLRTLQKRLANAMDELDVCEKDSATGDNPAMTSSPAHATTSGSGGTAFQTKLPIPFRKISPTELVGFLSELCGPVAGVLFVPFPGESSAFAMTVQFWDHTDASRFAGFMDYDENMVSQKHRRTEVAPHESDTHTAVTRERLRIIKDAQFIRVEAFRVNAPAHGLLVPLLTAGRIATARQAWCDCLRT